MSEYKKITYFFNEKPIVILLVITILLMSIGYSAFSSSLAVDGSAFLRPISDVRITSVTLSSETNGGTLNENLEFGKKKFYINGHVPSALGSNGNLIVDVTITNLSSSSVMITDIKNNSFSNINMNYQYVNITPNETIIPPASSYTFQVKISFNSGIISTLLKFTESLLETLFGISTNVISEFEVSWYKMAQYNYTINATPNDSAIVVKINNAVVGSTTSGSFTTLVDADTIVEWSVSKDGYYPQSGSTTVIDDTVEIITLEAASMHKITINPTPSDASVIFKNSNGDILSSGVGSSSIDVYDLVNITYEVTKEGYTSVSDTIHTNGSDISLNITIEETAYLDKTIKNTSSTVATTGSETISHTGYYLIEIWGGNGGMGYATTSSNKTSGGNSGYAYGVVKLNSNDKIYYTIGGNGSDSTGTGSASSGGANGGGRSNAGGGGGGGYSIVSLNSSAYDESGISSNSILIIASGGGGGGGRGLVSAGGNGGDGANMLSATTSISNATVYTGSNGNGTASNYIPTAGSSVAGSNPGQSASSGSFLNGGLGYYRGGGGGSGYYGGAGGSASSSSGGASGGAGGSNYISNSVLTLNDTSLLIGINPSNTGGSLYIKYIGSTY